MVLLTLQSTVYFAFYLLFILSDTITFLSISSSRAEDFVLFMDALQALRVEGGTQEATCKY
jgi:hypothetical protein